LIVLICLMQDERMRLSEQLAAASEEQSAALHLTNSAYHLHVFPACRMVV
jgi:hypothetical protein